MVCLGNICRSPLAEGILQSKLPNDKFFVDSAGTSGFHNGNPPDTRSIEVAKKNGLNISNQTSRLFKGYDFELFDHIFVMDQSNYNAVIRQAQNDKDIEKVKFILNFSGSKIKEVPDPYYGGEKGFEHVYKMLDTACKYHSECLKNNL